MFRRAQNAFASSRENPFYEIFSKRRQNSTIRSLFRIHLNASSHWKVFFSIRHSTYGLSWCTRTHIQFISASTHARLELSDFEYVKITITLQFHCFFHFSAAPSKMHQYYTNMVLKWQNTRFSQYKRARSVRNLIISWCRRAWAAGMGRVDEIIGF